MAQLSCPHCGSPVNVGPQHAGRPVRCPSCQGQMMIPAGGGGGGGRSVSRSGKGGKKKSKKGDGGNSGLIIGLSAGIGGVAILAAVIVFIMMNRDDGGDSVASNTSSTSSTTTGTTNTNPTMPNTPMGTHGAPATAQSTPMGTTPAGTTPAGTLPMGTTPMGTTTPPGDTSTSTPIASTTPMTTTEPVPVSDTSQASTQDVPVKTNTDGLPTIPDADLALTDLTRFVQPGVVRLEVETEFGGGLGSGFVVNKQGVIVTNYHVIAGAVSAQAFFETEEGFPVTGAWHLDKDRDIAILQIDCPPEKLFPVNIASELPAQGLDVAAFGAPHGLSFTVTRGIVSAIRRGEELDHTGTLVQHDVSINPGNSGGPLCTFRGEVVAINTFLLRNSQNLNFAISCLDIRDCLSKMFSETLAISPQNIPGQQGEIPGAVDYTDTEKGDSMLARIRELDVFTLNLAQDPQGVIERYLEETAERQIERADIDFNKLDVVELSQLDFRNPVMIVIYHFTLPEETEENEDNDNLYLDVMVHMQVVMTDVNAEGKPEICIIWNREEERIGSVAPAALARGQLPNSVEQGITQFIGDFVGRCRRARNAQ